MDDNPIPPDEPKPSPLLKVRTKLDELRDFLLLRKVKLLHAWILAFAAVTYIALAAPLALQSLVLVLAKVWIGALVGYSADRAVFSRYDPTLPDPGQRFGMPGAAWEFRRMGLIGFGMLSVALGV